MRFAVIPARGGSKRIPRKNIREFAGKPMIAWSIAAALESGCFDGVIVSTDDAEIAVAAKMYGASVPFLRPSELSDDYTGTLPVMRHAVDWLSKVEGEVDLVCCIYATAPFVRPTDLQRGLNKLQATGMDYSVSVTSYAFPIQRALAINEHGCLNMIRTEMLGTRSQDLPEVFHDAGQFYWGTASAWSLERPVFAGNSVPVVLPRHRVQDIDTEEDWIRAEWLFRAMASASPLS